MSGFFGIFRPQGGPVDLEAFEQMKTAMDREGFDGMQTHVEEKIAMGHLMLRVSPASKYDKQPLKSACGNYLLVGHFRLDYRDELGDKLGLTQVELESTPDSQLAMMAYQKWKEKCVHHLEGDWAFVIFNMTDLFLLLFKSPTGNSCCYFYVLDGMLLFCDEISGILEVLGNSAKIDDHQLARVMIPMVKVKSGFTLLKNLFQLKPGEFLYFSKSLSSVKENYYSHVRCGTLKYKFTEDYIFSFESSLRAAILTRVKNECNKGILLSSGRDSSSLCYFLAKEMEYRNSRLDAFTLKLAFGDSFTQADLLKHDESLLVSEYVKNFKNVNLQLVDAKENSFYELFHNRDSYQFQSPIIPSHQLWIGSIFKRAKKNGINSMITGQFGNYTLSVTSNLYFINLLKGLNFNKFLKDFTNLKKNSKKSYRFLFGFYILSPVKNYLKWQLKKFSNLSSLKDSFGLNSLDNFISEHLSKSKLIDESFVSGATHYLNGEKLKRVNIMNNCLFVPTAWWYMSKQNGIEVSDPSFDIRFIEASLAIPEEIFFYNGQSSYLFNRMMQSKPEYAILNDGVKRFQMMDLGFRLEQDSSLNKLIDELEQLPPYDPGFKDLFLRKLNELYCESDYHRKYTLGYKLVEKISIIHFLKYKYYIYPKNRLK